MGQAAAVLPDPLEKPPLEPTASADDLLSQMAGDEIDRLLAEAEVERTPPAEAPAPGPPSAAASAQVAASARAEPAPAPESAAPVAAVQQPRSGRMTVNDDDPEISRQLDDLFAQLNEPVETPKEAGLTAEEDAAKLNHGFSQELDNLFAELNAEEPVAPPPKAAPDMVRVPASKAAPAAAPKVAEMVRVPAPGNARPAGPAEMVRIAAPADVVPAGRPAEMLRIADAPAEQSPPAPDPAAAAAVDAAGAAAAPAPATSTIDAASIAVLDVVSIHAPAADAGMEEDAASAAEKQALTADLPGQETSLEAKPRPTRGRDGESLLVRILRWLNAPLAGCSDELRDAMGKVAIMTLLNAVAILVYVLVFRR